MKCGRESGQLVMYKIPIGVGKVTIKPLVENADFQYNSVNYSFGEINENTKGSLKVFSKTTVEGQKTTFVIENAPDDTSSQQQTDNTNHCPWCGGEHNGFIQGIIGFFHRIFAKIFGARY